MDINKQSVFRQSIKNVRFNQPLLIYILMKTANLHPNKTEDLNQHVCST